MIRPAMILITLLASGLGLTLFVVKYQVQDLEGTLIEYNRKITEDSEAIHVLKAEWSHLNRPSRLRHLSERHLGMGLIQPTQVNIASEFFSKLIASDMIAATNAQFDDLQLLVPLKAQDFKTELNE
ncbi:MAG: hypothetical protein VX923_04985 [Pseudomonadota bacterium]|nr:hypothetical protein [Pseudomonadota bacterium]